MKRFSLVALSLVFALRVSATTFDFVFDNDTNPGIQTPLVGTGFFTFANDPGIGTFAFNSLGAFSMGFSFTGGASFTQADILSDLSQVFVVLSTFGSERRLQFTDDGDGSGGPFVGSLDFGNGSGFLTFEPSYNGTGLRFYASNTFFGDYLATTGGAGVPEGGSTLTLTLLSVMGVVGMHRLLRTRSRAASLS